MLSPIPKVQPAKQSARTICAKIITSSLYKANLLAKALPKPKARRKLKVSTKKDTDNNMAVKKPPKRKAKSETQFFDFFIQFWIKMRRPSKSPYAKKPTNPMDILSLPFFNKTMKFLNCEASRYKAHSFRIGAATTAALIGIPVDITMQAGKGNHQFSNLY
ncbi:hypothetical protein LOTGIDRAFT_168086 [Lottia gigantea]|uniref:Uncharacterized protein n=1 Tax=Lottia gigantea TaxID=225164 RepID=V3ZR79_LOTGI|nr:hypothetical protein LOTGIDRAFT_168086 [Lottia gigantea]ESO85065.1 hypothetical protein LOTGIDRAFT_168086 [Lottia gigantea]